MKTRELQYKNKSIFQVKRFFWWVTKFEGTHEEVYQYRKEHGLLTFGESFTDGLNAIHEIGRLQKEHRKNNII